MARNRLLWFPLGGCPVKVPARVHDPPLCNFAVLGIAPVLTGCDYRTGLLLRLQAIRTVR